MKEPVGVIGLGRMGLPLALNLVREGFKVFGCGLENVERLVAAGGCSATNPADVARQCRFIVQSLPSSAALDRVLHGPEGLLDVLRPGSIVIETSTYPLAIKTTAANAVAAKNAIMLDCEITGVPDMVADRSCVLFISGGNQESFDRCRPVFDAISTAAKIHLGPFGAATKMKLVNNLLVCIHVTAAAEALNFGMKIGLRPDHMLTLIGSGAASSVMFRQRGPLMVERTFSPSSGPFRSLSKFPPAIQGLGAEVDAATPLLDIAANLFKQALDEGRAEQDVAALIDIIEHLRRPPVSKP